MVGNGRCGWTFLRPEGRAPVALPALLRLSMSAPCCAVSALGFSARRRPQRSVERVLANLYLTPTAETDLAKEGRLRNENRKFPRPHSFASIPLPKVLLPSARAPFAAVALAVNAPPPLSENGGPWLRVSALRFSSRRRPPGSPGTRANLNRHSPVPIRLSQSPGPTSHLRVRNLAAHSTP